MTSPSRNHRKLTSLDAGRVLGGASRSTVRRRAETNTLPPGWWAEKEKRRQGEQWVFYVPEDDPLLTRWDLAGQVPLPPQDVPSTGQDVPAAPGGPADDGPYQEPRLTVPEIRDALIAPLVQRLAEVDRQATTRWEALRAASETIGRFQVLVEVAQQQVTRLEQERDAALRRATAHETELQRARSTNERLALSLAERTHLVEQLQVALTAAAGDELADLRAALAAERDARVRAEAETRAALEQPAPRRHWRWVAWLLGEAD